MEFNKKYGPYALQVYLYLAKNADSFNLALSQQAAENEAGIKRTTFHKYIDLLIREGYLVWRSGNTYDFYETPREPREKPPHDGKDCAWDDKECPGNDLPTPPDDLKCPQADREIDNIYRTDIIDKETDNQQEEEEIESETHIHPKSGEYVF